MDAKNLKVRPETHKKIKIGAANEGVQIYDYADAVISVGLKYEKEIKQLLEDDKKMEFEQEKQK